MNTVTSRQGGMSIITWIFIIAVALFFGLLGIKMIPSYMEFYSIQTVMASIQQDRNMKSAPFAEIRKSFFRRIDMNGVYDFDRKDLKVTRARGNTIIEVRYEKRKELAGNVDVVMSFYKQVEM